MPISWLAALKMIPWATLVTSAPSIARAAETLLTGTKARRERLATAADLQHMAERVAALEQQAQANAELLKQISDDLTALTMTVEILGARVRWAMTLAVVALVASAVVGAILVFR